MAKATEKWATITREVVTRQNVSVRAGVTLELTDEEAAFIAFVLNRIGGSPTQSARAVSESISSSLAKAGYSGWYGDATTENWTEKSNRAIYFTPASLDVFKGEIANG